VLHRHNQRAHVASDAASTDVCRSW
jgi:hypothetical protein